MLTCVFIILFFGINILLIWDLIKHRACNTYLLCTLDEACLIAATACYWALGDGRNKDRLLQCCLRSTLSFHQRIHLLARAAALGCLPVATWRQTTGLCVVSGSVWGSRVLDCRVSAGRHTNCPAVCASCRLVGCSCTAPSSSSSRCHTSESTAKSTFGLKTLHATSVNSETHCWISA